MPGPSPPAGPGSGSAFRLSPNAMIGAAVIVVGLFLPWIRATGLGSANAFDLPLGVLWNSSNPGDPDLGLPLLILAAVVALPLRAPLATVAAAAIFVAVVVFVVQLQRSDIELTSVLGSGVLVTAGGALVAFPWKRATAP